jgi:hypothetical protein
MAAIAFFIICLTFSTATAQSEKVSLKMVPEPNQTVRMKMVQEMEMEMKFDGDASTTAVPAGPMKMLAKTVFAMTQRVAAPDKQGNILSEVVYDEVSSEITMNGQPLPVGDEDGKFKGKKILATYNKEGGLVDIKIPPDIGLPEEALKQMMKSIYGNLPQTSIGLGETATSPLDFIVPIPVPGAPPLKMDGLMKFKLVAIDKDAAGRIAKFDQSVDGKMISDLEIPTPDGNVKMSVDFKMNGEGDIAVNLEKGFVKSGDSKSSFGGRIKMTSESSEAKLPAINLQGTITVKLTGTN